VAMLRTGNVEAGRMAKAEPRTAESPDKGYPPQEAGLPAGGYHPEVVGLSSEHLLVFDVSLLIADGIINKATQ